MSKFPRYLPLYPLKWDASLCAPTEAPQAQSSLQNGIVDITGGLGYLVSYWVVVVGLIYLLYYALVGSKNVNKDIPV